MRLGRCTWVHAWSSWSEVPKNQDPEEDPKEAGHEFATEHITEQPSFANGLQHKASATNKSN